MKKFTTRSLEQRDAQDYIDWLKAAADINLVDWNVYGYPTTNTVVVEAEGAAVLINSYHGVLMMEALAPKPGIEPRDEARALLALYEEIRKVAVALGIREIWFACADERVHQFIERKGWKKVNTPVYRMMVGGDTDPCNKPRPGQK